MPKYAVVLVVVLLFIGCKTTDTITLSEMESARYRHAYQAVERDTVSIATIRGDTTVSDYNIVLSSEIVCSAFLSSSRFMDEMPDFKAATGIDESVDLVDYDVETNKNTGCGTATSCGVRSNQLRQLNRHGSGEYVLFLSPINGDYAHGQLIWTPDDDTLGRRCYGDVAYQTRGLFFVFEFSGIRVADMWRSDSIVWID